MIESLYWKMRVCQYSILLTPVQGAIQQLYSVQCDAGASVSLDDLASIQCLNVPQGGTDCDQFLPVSLTQALLQAGVSK